MNNIGLPDNLISLHKQEELLRLQAMTAIADREKMLLHLCAIERAMTLAKIVVEHPTKDEDFKVFANTPLILFWLWVLLIKNRSHTKDGET